jgi:hypothetical protein
MRYLRYLTLLSFLVVPMLSAHAGVAVGVSIGPGYVGPPPVCAYGYYSYYPYACAPRGYYGPNWFAGGVFIGAGPWYHGYYGPGFYRPGYGPGWYGRGWYGRGWYGPGAYGHGPYAYRAPSPAFRGGVARGFRR